MKGKGKLGLIIFLFLLPVGLAKLILEMKWYDTGQLNQGTLLSTASPTWLPERDKWQLFYRLPEVCEASCQGALFTLKQLPLAVGVNRHRVSSLVVMSETQFAALPLALDEQLQDLDIWLVKDEYQGEENDLSLGKNAIYLSDPLGSVVLGYPIASTKTEVLKQGKALLKDLTRLLKLSRIG